MGQQTFVQRDLAGPRHVIDRAARAQMGQRLAIFLEGHLGLVAQAHQRLDASQCAAAPRPLRDLGRRHRPGARLARVLAKRAVGAAVAAEIGDRQKDLARISDDPALGAIAHLARRRQQGRQLVRGTLDKRDGVGLAETRAIAHPVQDFAHLDFAYLRGPGASHNR